MAKDETEQELQDFVEREIDASVVFTTSFRNILARLKENPQKNPLVTITMRDGEGVRANLASFSGVNPDLESNIITVVGFADGKYRTISHFNVDHILKMDVLVPR